LSNRKVIPEYIFCPKCGSQIWLTEDNSPETLEKLKEQGYTAMGVGTCDCGVVAVLCWQPLPASPTFSLFFDIFPVEATKKAKEILIARKRKALA
jgi:coenzyme F420-reducing hydrogenase gamma subunit